MRKSILLFALAALPFVAVNAQAAPYPKLTLSVSTYKVLYGHQLLLSGRLLGGGSGKHAVKIESWRYGSSAPRGIATVATGTDGRWSWHVKPAIQTTYLAHAGPITSARRTVGIRPLVVVRELGNGHVWVHVSGGRSFATRIVELQRATAGTWHTIARKRLSSASIAAFAPSLPTSTLRVAMSVNQAGAGYLGTTSHALTYRSYALTLSPSSYKVLSGHKLTLSGDLVNGQARARIAILAWRFGRSTPSTVAVVTTGAHGTWSYRVGPSIQTTYQAVWERSKASARVTIGVRPLLTIRELGNGHLSARVTAARSFDGKMLQLQQLMNGTWRTVAKQPLSRSSSTSFAVPLSVGSTVRAALSVNQAGAGYLGTTSHSLLYRSF